MKKVLQYIGIGILILFAVGSILSSIDKIRYSKDQLESAPTLEDMISKVNRLLPSKAADGFDYYILNRVVLEKNNIVWDATFDRTFIYPTRESFLPESMNGAILPFGNRKMALDLDTLLSSHMLKQSHQLFLLYYHLFAKNGKENPLYEEIKKHKYSQTWRIQSPFSDRRNEFTITYKEMTQIEDFCKQQPDSALRLFLSKLIERQNRLLTIASGNADVTMRMIDEGDNFVFCYTFDHSHSDGGNSPVEYLRNHKVETQAALEEDSRTLPIFYDLKPICNKTQKGFLFRIIDWDRTDSLEFKIF